MTIEDRFDEAMAINATGAVYEPLTADSLATMLGALLGVNDRNVLDISAYYEAIGRAVARLQEEAVSAKFRDALRASAPSDGVRDGLARILDAIGATDVESAIGALRDQGEQRREMYMELKALRQMDEDNQDAIDRQKGRLVVLNQRVMDAEDDADAAREDFAALVDLYTKAIR